MFRRWFGHIYEKRQRILWEELIPLLLPLSMFLFGDIPFTWSNVKRIFLIWQYIILGASFLFNIIAVNAGHHGPSIVHEGDEFKSLDYGIYQLGATAERIETKSNLFMTLTHFGDHVLHHMFPSLDHSLLPQLNEIFVETCIDFKEEIKFCTMLEALIWQFQQLSRTETIKLNENNKVTNK